MAAATQLHLADLHERAAQAGIPAYRKLTRFELIEALGLDPGEVEAAAEVLEPAGDEPFEEDEEARAPSAAAPAAEADTHAEDDASAEAETVELGGVLELTRQRYGFLRRGGLTGGDDDVYISAAQVRRCELRPGDHVSGPAREPRRGERHRALVHVDRVNGNPLESEEARPQFEDLDPALPDRRVTLDTDGADVLVRAVDLFAPLALGQRVLVRAAPRSGRTTLLRALGQAAVTGAEATAIVLLIDERPEEAPAWRRALPDAEFAVATADQAPVEQLRIAELATERARRLAEAGVDVLLICDSLSRLAHAAGGIDEVKRLFGTGRNLAEGGSVTVIATTLAGGADEGAADRAVITTESSLITLDPDLAASGVYPAIVATECRISNEDEIRDGDELEAVRQLRSLLADLDRPEAARLLRERIEGSPSNSALLADLR